MGNMVIDYVYTVLKLSLVTDSAGVIFLFCLVVLPYEE